MAATKQKQPRKSRKTQEVNQKPKLDERFIIEIQGRRFCKYEGLLDMAHQIGLKRLEVTPIQCPSSENGMLAICRAVAESKTGEVFSDIGDANPGNVSAMVSRHILRIASTRAKARVLRDFVDVGMTALEELDFDEVNGTPSSNGFKPSTNGNGNGNGNGNKHENQEEATAPKKNGARSKKGSKTEPSKPPKSEEPATKPETKGSNGNGKTPKMSEAQKRAIQNLSQRRGISSEELEALALKNYNKEIEALSAQDASALIQYLQAA